MKVLFICCLGLLIILKSVQAEVPSDLIHIVSKSNIPNKKVFLAKLNFHAKLNNLCPKLLYSLGISQWEKLPESAQDPSLNELAQLAPYLKDFSDLSSSK